MHRLIWEVLIVSMATSLGYCCKTSGGVYHQKFTCSEQGNDILPYNESSMIEHNNNGNYQSTSCNWTIPERVQKEAYYVVIRMKTIHLPTSQNVCNVALQLPGEKFQCEPHLKKGDYWVYTSNYSDCITSTTVYNCSINRRCKKITFWKDLEDPAVIIYNAKSGFYQNRSFSIEYLPTKCASVATTTINSTTTRKPPPISFEDHTNIQSKQTSALQMTSEAQTLEMATITLNDSINGQDRQTPVYLQNHTLIPGIVAGVSGFLLVILITGIALRWHKREQQKKKSLASSTNNGPGEDRGEKTIYENSVKTTDGEGYEIPGNPRQYQNLQVDGQYENLKDDYLYEVT